MPALKTLVMKPSLKRMRAACLQVPRRLRGGSVKQRLSFKRHFRGCSKKCLEKLQRAGND